MFTNLVFCLFQIRDHETKELFASAAKSYLAVACEADVCFPFSSGECELSSTPGGRKNGEQWGGDEQTKRGGEVEGVGRIRVYYLP